MCSIRLGIFVFEFQPKTTTVLYFAATFCMSSSHNIVSVYSIYMSLNTYGLLIIVLKSMYAVMFWGERICHFKESNPSLCHLP